MRHSGNFRTLFLPACAAWRVGCQAIASGNSTCNGTSCRVLADELTRWHSWSPWSRSTESLPPWTSDVPTTSLHTQDHAKASIGTTNLRGEVAVRADFAATCAWVMLTPNDEIPMMPDRTSYYGLVGLVFASTPLGGGGIGSLRQINAGFADGSKANTDEVYRVRGRYPFARYFSYQTYDARLESVAQIHDKDVRPCTGKNPYTDPSASVEEAGTYEVYITKDGKRGYPNELAAGRPGGGSTLSLVTFRLYLPEPPSDLNVTKSIEWGFVDPPVVELLHPGTGTWSTLTHCPDVRKARLEGIFTALNVGFSHTHFNWDLLFRCSTPAFSLFDARLDPEISAAIRVRNENIRYIYWCMPKDVKDRNYVLHITGTLPQTPAGLFVAPRVALPSDYDVRYISFTTGDATPAFPSFNTLSDRDITQFYVHGSSSDWDKRYSIVASRDAGVARRCGLLQEDRDMFLSFSRPPLESAHVPAIVMRHMLTTQGFEHSSTERFNRTCLNEAGNVRCKPEQGGAAMLEQYYPVIEIYACNLRTNRSVRVH